jgi:diketogulonate reductase-like aldo/keto reductase
MTTTTTPPTLTLNGGVAIPVLGLGVFQSPPEETTAAVEAAIAAGYRLIDTAASYDNEREVSEAIRRFGGSIAPRPTSTARSRTRSSSAKR